MQFDSGAPALSLDKYIYNETRYSMLKRSQPEAAAELYKLAQESVNQRWALYEYMAKMPGNAPAANGEPVPTAEVKEEKK